MKINIVNPNSFNAHQYCISKFGSFYELSKIRTENPENLGQEPVILGKENNTPMHFDGKYYTAEVPSSTDKYKIFYRDTKKFENGGKEVRIDPLALLKNIIVQERINLGKPLEVPFSKGEAEGIVVDGTKPIPKDKPVIVLLDRIKQDLSNIAGLPKNVKAVITSECDEGQLSHAANVLRVHFPVMSAIYDNFKLHQLKKMIGKKVVINNESGILEYKKIKHFGLKPEQKKNPILIPQLTHVDEILGFDELTQENTGNKGLRLGIMSKLVKDNVLKDIIIPNGIVLPTGYIEKIINTITTDSGDIDSNKIYDNEYIKEINDKCIENHLTDPDYIVRSNFNAEDLNSFSSAGIYNSVFNFNREFILSDILCVVDSKDSPLAVNTRKRYGIADNLIQPSVIIQEYKHPDFKFTMYTKDANKNVCIEMEDMNLISGRPAPAVIIYNTKNKKLALENKQNAVAEFWIDEQGQIIEETYEEDKIAKQWNTLTPLLNTIVTGGLLLESVFKAPQDIEGGIKDGKVYFWQTRDIVSNLAKKIKR